jgi:hypothetical protein
MHMILDKVPSNQMPSSGLPEAVAMIEREAASHWVDVRDLPELKEARDGGELLNLWREVRACWRGDWRLSKRARPVDSS